MAEQESARRVRDVALYHLSQQGHLQNMPYAPALKGIGHALLYIGEQLERLTAVVRNDEEK
jgi:hypothetical protein